MALAIQQKCAELILAWVIMELQALAKRTLKLCAQLLFFLVVLTALNKHCRFPP